MKPRERDEYQIEIHALKEEVATVRAERDVARTEAKHVANSYADLQAEMETRMNERNETAAELVALMTTLEAAYSPYQLPHRGRVA